MIPPLAEISPGQGETILGGGQKNIPQTSKQALGKADVKVQQFRRPKFANQRLLFQSLFVRSNQIFGPSPPIENLLRNTEGHEQLWRLLFTRKQTSTCRPERCAILGLKTDKGISRIQVLHTSVWVQAAHITRSIINLIPAFVSHARLAFGQIIIIIIFPGLARGAK